MREKYFDRMTVDGLDVAVAVVVEVNYLKLLLLPPPHIDQLDFRRKIVLNLSVVNDDVVGGVVVAVVDGN